MEFKIERQELKKEKEHKKDDLDIAYKFTNQIYKEFGDFVKAVILFGSSARKDIKPGDIDILIIVDDVSLKLTEDVAETYRIIVEKCIADTSLKLHITTLKFSSFWEYIRSGDPVGINILREGLPLLDSGFFRPMQLLLQQGRVRPTPESIWTYFSKAPATLHNSKWHLLQATLDLYWAVIDSAHAALMSLDEIPPSPDHVADLIEQRMVKPGLIDRKYATTMRNFYKLSKMILHREIKEIEGAEFDGYFKEAYEFVKVMKEFIEKKK